MLAVLQRVTSSAVTVDGVTVGAIGRGLNILLGVVQGDTETDVETLVAKIIHLRIFPDENGKMNRSLLDVGGEALVISQFTLAANVKKGRRPAFDNAAPPQEAERLYGYFVARLREHLPVQTGRFGAHMQVDIVNDGPVTILVDTTAL